MFNHSIFSTAKYSSHLISRGLFFLISLLFFASTRSLLLMAQQESDAIDQLFSSIATDEPGCSCSFSKNGEVLFNKAYGLANMETKTPLQPSSVLDAGSVVKQFVAASTLLLVEQGQLSLHTDIHEYLPELPPYEHPVTLYHLLTHTSGIRDWTGIRMISAADEDALTMVLRQKSLNFAPGEQWSYSNSGYVLLKEIVARVTGLTFGEFASTYLFEPLGMKNTTYTQYPDKTSNLALAYEKGKSGWENAVLENNDRGGGGALMTTAPDLLLWTQALAQQKLGEFVTNNLLTPTRLNNGRELSYTKGLFVTSNELGKLIWHTGSAGGYKSLVGHLPAHGLSIAIMCNSGDQINRTALAGRIFRLFAEPQTQSYPPGKEDVMVPEDILNTRSGWYIHKKDKNLLQLTVNKNRLAIVGGPMLSAKSNTHFINTRRNIEFRSEDQFEIEFQPNGSFTLTSMEGQQEIYVPVETYRPAIDELSRYEGRYESKDLKAVFQIKATEKQLVVYLEHAPMQRLPFSPVVKDMFVFRRMHIGWIRDDQGSIVALTYSNPVLKDVRFTRLNN